MGKRIRKVYIMLGNKDNNEQCSRLMKLLNTEIKFKTGARVLDIELGYDIYTNSRTLGIVINKSCMASELVMDYMLKMFGLRHLCIDESMCNAIRNDRILYSGLSRDKLMGVDVLCRMKGY